MITTTTDSGGQPEQQRRGRDARHAQLRGDDGDCIVINIYIYIYINDNSNNVNNIITTATTN